MKIVVVNTFDVGGGAERISSALADGLRDKGHEVSLLCGQAYRNTSRAMSGPVDWVLGRVIKRIGYADAISLAAWRFLQNPEVREADVLHFHNLHGFYFGMAMLPQIIAAKPCVWTLHDCWAISGGCYWQINCDNWLHSCKPCPGHGTHPMTGFFDTAGPMLQMKRRAFQAMVCHGGHITGVSPWMTERIRQAFTAAHLDTSLIHCIPNAVDIPANENKDSPGMMLSERPNILIIAANIANPNKGMRTALGALQRNLNTDFTLVTVGLPFPEKVLHEYGLADRTIQLGKVGDRSKLADVYRASLVTLVPSLAESFCLVAAESITCGTPVIASDVTALPDLILDGQTGFLAKVNDVEDFSSRLKTIFKMKPEDYSKLRSSAQEFARQQFISSTLWLDSYLNIYEKAISDYVQ